MAELDRRIGYLEKSTEDLRQEMAHLDTSSHQYLRLSDLLRMGEDTVTKLRAERNAMALHNLTDE